MICKRERRVRRRTQPWYWSLSVRTPSVARVMFEVSAVSGSREGLSRKASISDHMCFSCFLYKPVQHRFADALGSKSSLFFMSTYMSNGAM